MSVETKSQEIGCFFCYHPIPPLEKCVEWQGCRKSKSRQHDIQLHAKCAVMLGMRLIGDAFTANPKVDDPASVLDLTANRMELRDRIILVPAGRAR